MSYYFPYQNFHCSLSVSFRRDNIITFRNFKNSIHGIYTKIMGSTSFRVIKKQLLVFQHVWISNQFDSYLKKKYFTFSWTLLIDKSSMWQRTLILTRLMWSELIRWIHSHSFFFKYATICKILHTFNTFGRKSNTTVQLGAAEWPRCRSVLK